MYLVLVPSPTSKILDQLITSPMIASYVRRAGTILRMSSSHMLRAREWWNRGLLAHGDGMRWYFVLENYIEDV